MPGSHDIIVYSLESCPNCEILKEFLIGRGLSFSERDLSTAEALADLRINGVFVREAPVLRNGDRFLVSGDMFAASGLRTDTVLSFLEGH
ncbi:MAG: glutaredoxin family protein [Methanolinea sp.]|nr:glutaredoxin family protein [Methanolinea sp.]